MHLDKIPQIYPIYKNLTFAPSCETYAMQNSTTSIKNTFFLSSFHLALLVLTLSFFLFSCQKEVHINLGSSPPQLVVQGAIETNLPPYVVLTSTISFFSTVDLATLEKSFVHDAVITISDGIKTIPLKEYSIDTGKNNKFYVYTIDTSNLANIMLGEENKFYTLNIISGGKTYTSTTKVPTPKGIDSLWFAKPIYPGPTTPDSALQLFVNYKDPDTLGNYVRYFTSRNNQLYYPSGIFSDEVVNGKNINNIGLFAGYDASQSTHADSLIFFYPGDTVGLKWCEIDYKVYKFWDTYAFASNAIGNPFASPINIQSNISNGALGVWAGYGSLIYTKIAHH